MTAFSTSSPTYFDSATAVPNLNRALGGGGQCAGGGNSAGQLSVLLVGESSLDESWNAAVLTTLRARKVQRLVLSGSALWLDFHRSLAGQGDASLVQGRFRDIVRFAAFRDEGLATALGRWLHQYRPAEAHESVMATAWAAGIPQASHLGSAALELAEFTKGMDGALGKSVYKDWLSLAEWCQKRPCLQWLALDAKDSTMAELLSAIRRTHSDQKITIMERPVVLTQHQ